MINYDGLKSYLDKQIDEHTQLRDKIQELTGINLEYCLGSIHAYSTIKDILENDWLWKTEISPWIGR